MILCWATFIAVLGCMWPLECWLEPLSGRRRPWGLPGWWQCRPHAGSLWPQNQPHEVRVGCGGRSKPVRVGDQPGDGEPWTVLHPSSATGVTLMREMIGWMPALDLRRPGRAGAPHRFSSPVLLTGSPHRFSAGRQALAERVGLISISGGFGGRVCMHTFSERSHWTHPC